MINDPRRRQAAFNAASGGHWDAFSGHRRKLSALLGAGEASAPVEPRRGRLCVLGAGNGNDLDLPALLEAHREVHLVDLDAGALARGVARQGVADHPALRCSAGVDLTGMIDAIASWSPRATIRPEELAALAEGPADRVAPALPGPFDLAASTCLLRPLIAEAFHAVGEGHPQFPDVVKAIRLGHLRLLTHLVAPGGAAVLITDLASTDTFPALADLPESSLPGLLPRLARDRSFFHGVNPDEIPSLFRRDPDLEARVTGLQSAPPWRWTLHGRIYLVWALKYQVVAPRGPFDFDPGDRGGGIGRG